MGNKIKNLKEKIRVLKSQKENSDKLKSDFLSQISHEIRTPVNSILAFSSLIQHELDDNLTKDLKTSFGIIESGGRRLVRTIDLIMNMSELNSESYQPIYRQFNLEDEIILPVVNEFKSLAIAKSLELEYSSGANGAKFVKADMHSVTQVIIQILDNAVKFTDSGSINICLSNKNNSLCVDVSDTGIGISEDYIPYLFEPFQQEENGYTRRYEGNGLGLAISKKFAEINSIKIDVKSKKNKGSTFSIIFPQN